MGKTRLCVDAGTALMGLLPFEKEGFSTTLQDKIINNCSIKNYEECNNVVKSKSGTKDCIIFYGITSCLAMIIDAGDSVYIFCHVVECSNDVEGKEKNIELVLGKINKEYKISSTSFKKIWLFDYKKSWEASVKDSIVCGAGMMFIDYTQESIDIVVAMGDSIKYVIHDRKKNTWGSEIQL